MAVTGIDTSSVVLMYSKVFLEISQLKYLAVRSDEQLANILSSGWKIALSTGAVCSEYVLITFCVLMSHNLVLPSSLPLNKQLPSGEISIEFICLV